MNLTLQFEIFWYPKGLYFLNSISHSCTSCGLKKTIYMLGLHPKPSLNKWRLPDVFMCALTPNWRPSLYSNRKNWKITENGELSREHFPSKHHHWGLACGNPCGLATFSLAIWKKKKKKQIVKTYITKSNDPIQFTQFSLSDPGLINLHHDVVYSSKHHHAEPLLAVTSISALQLRRLNVKDRPMARS